MQPERAGAAGRGKRPQRCSSQIGARNSRPRMPCKLRAYFAKESGSAMLEIGIGLRQTRESRGLVLADAEAETRIRARYLAALEEEQFEALPEGYARTFLRSYANYLGLDG